MGTGAAGGLVSGLSEAARRVSTPPGTQACCGHGLVSQPWGGSQAGRGLHPEPKIRAALCGGHGSVCMTVGRGASLPTAGALGGPARGLAWLYSRPRGSPSVSRGSTSIPRVGLGAATASPEGLWAWPHHGRGLSHGVQIKPGSQTYLACTAVWPGERQDFSVGFCFSFANGASRSLPAQPTPQSQSEQRGEPLLAKRLGRRCLTWNQTRSPH